MGEHNRVVSLRTRSGARSASLPPALMRLRDASGQSFSAILSEFFDQADDALFSIAEKANSDQDQTAYFEAMRELRLRRKSMSLSMLHWVSRAFNDIGTFDSRRRSDGLQGVDQEPLSLVGHGDHEQQVAIDNLVSKLRSAYSKRIGMLGARIHHLLPDLDLNERQMPLSPEVICSALQQACEGLDIDIRAKIVVIKLFDKLLLSKLETFYQDANKLLVSEGILPEMTRPPADRRKQTQPNPSITQANRSSTGHQPEMTADHQGSGEYGATFAQLSELLHRSGATVASPPTLASAGDGSGAIIDRNLLMQCLADLQGSAPGAGYYGSGESTRGSSRLTVQLGSALEQQAYGLDSLPQVDADVLKLVTMLFDFILEDRQLPSHLKALIGRLQIPILKVALLDRSFFNRGGHPARKLLNELATAGMGWNQKAEGQRDPLRDKLESVVDRLLNDFSDNVELFQEVLDDFTHFMNLDSRRRALIEQRLRDAEEGRARQERARMVCTGTLESLCAGHHLPKPVMELFEQPWSRYLQFLYLREGEDSEAWRMAVTTAEKLVWSVDPQPVTTATRAELLRQLPVIADALRRGLQAISWDPFASDRLIRDLELEHVNTLQQLALKAPQVEAKQKTPELQPTGEPLSSLQSKSVKTDPAASRAEASVIPASVVPEMAQAEPPATVQAIAAKPVPEKPITGDPLPATDKLESQWHSMAQKLGAGSWVEIVSGSQKMRCKLAAVIKATGKYIFVNRTGAKIAEYDLVQVANAMESGEIALLDDGLIFDRALESIIDNLRHSRRD